MTLTPHDNAHSAPIPPLRAEIILAPETVMALAQEIARVIIGFLKILLQEAQAAQNRTLLTPEEVAQYFRVNRQWVYERTSKTRFHTANWGSICGSIGRRSSAGARGWRSRR